jgi:hypothetical protein
MKSRASRPSSVPRSRANWADEPRRRGVRALVDSTIGTAQRPGLVRSAVAVVSRALQAGLCQAQRYLVLERRRAAAQIPIEGPEKAQR